MDPAASLIRDLNPELAAGFVWAWDQQKRPGSQGSTTTALPR